MIPIHATDNPSGQRKRQDLLSDGLFLGSPIPSLNRNLTPFPTPFISPIAPWKIAS